MRRRNLEISSAVNSDLMIGLASDSTLGLATNTGSLNIIFFGFHEGRSTDSLEKSVLRCFEVELSKNPSFLLG
jgi:hypothetical protein